MAYLVDCSEADIEEADADISQHTWLAFTPIIIGANVYFIGGCLFTWMMAIIDEIWRQGIPAVSVASGLIGLALAAVIGYVLASVASALSLAVVTSINKSLRNVIRPRTAAFLSGGLAAYLLTLPVLLSVAESGLDQAMLAFLIGPAAMMVLIHVAIAWSFRRADFLAAADRLLGQPIDRKTLTTAVTKKTGFRLKPARPSTLRMPNLSDVHPLDCSDDEGDAP